jgi:outer membrane protein assembly factor BamD
VICIDEETMPVLTMDDLKEDNLRILKQNYPNSPIFTKGKDTKKQDWWKFWDKT